MRLIGHVIVWLPEKKFYLVFLISVLDKHQHFKWRPRQEDHRGHASPIIEELRLHTSMFQDFISTDVILSLSRSIYHTYTSRDQYGRTDRDQGSPHNWGIAATCLHVARFHFSSCNLVPFMEYKLYFFNTNESRSYICTNASYANPLSNLMNRGKMRWNFCCSVFSGSNKTLLRILLFADNNYIIYKFANKKAWRLIVSNTRSTIRKT
jgi:hypothetical protein